MCREVNPYTKSCYFCKLFLCTLVDQVVHPFFLFPTNVISNKVKQACYKIMSINSLFIIYNDFSKIFKIVVKKKCGHHDLLFRRITKVGRKVGVKAATFLTGLPLS